MMFAYPKPKPKACSWTQFFF